jgi:NADH-quinone oxidoreductase subunit J
VIIQALAFYLFAAMTVAAGVMVISARNPVHSVLFLILAFSSTRADCSCSWVRSSWP